MMSRPHYYDAYGRPTDLEGVAAFYERPERIIEQTLVDTLTGALMVSTVALGIDHGFHTKGPLIFETMVFFVDVSGEWTMSELYADRYSTRAGAYVGHAHVLYALRGLRKFFWRRALNALRPLWGQDWGIA